MHRLGFIDEDRSQRNQFYQTFKADFEVCNIEAAAGDTVEKLVSEALTNHVELLLVDYQMSHVLGFNGDSIARMMSEVNPYFPVMIFTSYEEEALDFVDDANKVYGKDIWSGDDEAELQVFKKKINTLINSYNNRINEASETLSRLKAKKDSEGLTPEEEDRYMELNVFLEQVANKGGHLPRTFYSQETNKKLDVLLEKTEQLLDRLSKK